jgi:hypothetical protein
VTKFTHMLHIRLGDISSPLGGLVDDRLRMPPDAASIRLNEFSISHLALSGKHTLTFKNHWQNQLSGN